jgi:hypothetical protein
MIFDKICNYAEKINTKLKPLLDNTKLFKLPDGFDPTFGIMADDELFHLPFNITAIETKNFLIIVQDSKKNQVGINHDRSMVYVTEIHVNNRLKYNKNNIHDGYELMLLLTGDKAIGDKAIGDNLRIDKIPHSNSTYMDLIISSLNKETIQMIERISTSRDSFYLMIPLTITSGANDDKFRIKYTGQYIITSKNYSKNYSFNIKSFTDNLKTKDELDMAAYNICVLLFNTINYIQSPTNFIIQEKRIKKKKKNKKILRSSTRNMYTILNKKQTISLLNDNVIPKLTKSKEGHYRRAHPRKLKSPFFKHKQGQTIIIPSCWVGPTENKIGNKLYKVILD